MSPHARLSPPLGIAYLAGYLRREGHELDLLDLNISGFNPQRIRLALKRFQPDMVGISAFTETYPNAVRVADIVKEFNSDVAVVFGGPHPSIMPEQVLRESPSVDYVIAGEGEETLAALARALSSGEAVEDLTGLVYRKDGEPVANPRRAPLDPDSIGLPARDLLPLELYGENPFNVLTARGGCPYRCSFCSAAHIWEGKHRPRDVKAVVDEVEMLNREYGAAFIFFVDDIFTLRRSWVTALLEEMKRLDGRVTWGCGTRVDRVDEELINEMAAAGCTVIQYGVESGSQEILDSVKGIEKEAALDAVKWAVAAGMSTTASFMAPFPQDTEKTLRETFDFMKLLADEGAELLMSYTTPYPGTVFWEEADSLGLKILADDWGEFDAKHLIIETENLSAQRIEEIIDEEVRRIGLKKTA